MAGSKGLFRLQGKDGLKGAAGLACLVLSYCSRSMTQVTGLRDGSLLIPSPQQRRKWRFIPSSINGLASGIKPATLRAWPRFFAFVPLLFSFECYI